MRNPDEPEGDVVGKWPLRFPASALAWEEFAQAGEYTENPDLLWSSSTDLGYRLGSDALMRLRLLNAEPANHYSTSVHATGTST